MRLATIPIPVLDIIAFDENQRKLDPEVLRSIRKPYEGKHIAWSADGQKVVAWGETIEAVYAMLDDSGIASCQVCMDYVEPAGESPE